MEEIKGTVEDARRVTMTPKTHKQIVEAIRCQVDAWGEVPEGEEPYTKDNAVVELERGGFGGLARALDSLPEEAGAACYMAARMLRECFWMIKMQIGVCEASQTPQVLHTANGDIDMTGTLKLFGAA